MPTHRALLFLATLLVITATDGSTTTGSAVLPSRIDHLVYATPDLDRGIREVEVLTGVRANPGGAHPGRGTRNALIALGPTSYLEIIGPDPDQPPPSAPRAFGIDSLKESRLAAWAVKSTDVDRLRSEAVRNKVPLGEVMTGNRRRPDGVVLSWRYTDPSAMVGDGVVPFFIDWGQSPHPSRIAPKEAVLVALRAEHPTEERVKQFLQSLGLDVSVRHGPKAALVAVVDCPRGRVELR